MFFMTEDSADKKKLDREARLAERLRANLRRRKDVARKHKAKDTGQVGGKG